MRFEIQFQNASSAIEVAAAALDEALKQSTEGQSDLSLHRLVVGVIEDVAQHAYPRGMEGLLKLAFRTQGDKLEISIRDFGMPQDPSKLQQRLRCLDARQNPAADEVHWHGLGPDGNEIQVVKWLSDRDDPSAPSEQAATAVTSAPQQRYRIDRMNDQQAAQVSQLMYFTYGGTYFNEDVYYPRRIATQNDDDKVISFVALAEDGQVVGHYALEMNQQGAVAEAGQAVVHPGHRGRGLLDRLKQAAISAARELNLVGWFADAVSVHTRTQRSHESHDGQLTAIDLGIAPQSESFGQLSEQQSQRVTCLLYFHWLKPPTNRTIHVPQHHQPIVAEIYDRLGCPVQFGAQAAPVGSGALTVHVESRAGRAFIRVPQVGLDTTESIRNTKRHLVEQAQLTAVYVDLPIQSPAVAEVADELEAQGFGFVGIAPHFFKAGDVLRMVYLVNPLARDPIKTLEGFPSKMVDYVLAEQVRVRAMLTRHV